jgi:Eco57I restriction-modification methylase/TaqI-like C-terminal specificity domain
LLQRAGLEVTRAELRRSFLERGSRLEDRLQRRIVSTVIPQIAQGVLDDRQKRLGIVGQPTEKDLAETFRASLIFLYRLLFLLYAESREFLPIGDAGSLAVSLKKTREEIAARGGVSASTVLNRLQQAYAETDTRLYDRLSRLFRTREQGQLGRTDPGSAGRLFPSVAGATNHVCDSPACFLAEHKVSDRRLAIALDALSRDQTDRITRLEFVDYKSLDVRQLGSIHESLLGYKLCGTRIGPASRRDKPAQINRRDGQSERSLSGPSCEVSLLSQTKGRKASGSYYTPPAIVEYLVANTVGPVLDEKLHALRSDFRAERKQAQRGKREQPSVLFDRLFDLRVVDPAMGCGHFLVEAVNFIASRLLDFLTEFPGSRAHSALSRARQDVIRSATAQGQTISGNTLDDRSLIKRCVLERCIYGVDIDPMAVELTKATLALECGIPGAPFIFRESHLRCGNALVGDAGRVEAVPLSADAKPRVFNWHLEFPHIFVEASACAGFDCVVGNPPYVRIQNLDDALVRYLEQHFETAAGKFDLYIPFLERGTALLQENGILGMIVPNKFLTADYGAAFRRFATRQRLLRQLVDFESEQVFPGASTYCCLLFLSRRPGANVTVSRGSVERPIARETAVVSSTRFGEGPWNIKPTAAATRTQGVPLKTACRAIFQGLITGADRLLIGNRDGERIRLGPDWVDFDPEIFRPVLKGSDVRRFALRFSAHYVLYPYRLADGKTELIPEDELAARHPAAYRYLVKHRRELKKRGSPSMAYPAWYAHWCPRNWERFAAPKIVTQVLASRASFAFDRHGTYTFVGGGNAGVYGLIPRFTDEDRLWLLLAVLNSRIFDAQVQEKSSRFRGGYFSYARRFIENVLIPPIEELDVQAALPRQIVTLTKSRAKSPAECDNQLETEIEAAVDELYRCGTR